MLGETRPIPVNILVRKVKKTVHSNEETIILNSIQQMIDDGELKQLLKTKSLVIKHLISDELASDEKIEGIIKINTSQNGFVYKDGEKEASFFVPKIKLNGALDGDKVSVSALKMYLVDDKQSNCIDAQVNEVIEHKKNYFTATFKLDNKNQYFIKVDDPKFYFNVVLRDTSNLVNDAKILFEVYEYKDDVAYSEVKKIIGHESDVGNDILSLVYDKGLEPEFSEEVLEAANKLKID